MSFSRRLKCSGAADTRKLVGMQKHLAAVELELASVEEFAQQEALNASNYFQFGKTVFKNSLRFLGDFQKSQKEIALLELKLDSATNVAEQQALKLAKANDELYEFFFFQSG